MSFTFNFGGDDIGDSDEKVQEADCSADRGHAAREEGKEARPTVPTRRHTLDELLEALPSRMSYSSIDFDLGKTGSSKDQSSSYGNTIRLYRRDLFDARFQLIQEDGEEKLDLGKCSIENDAKGNSTSTIDAGTDLVPGLYEGGLKTWECALDLVGVLANLPRDAGPRSTWCDKQILELGCGTAIPSLYLLQDALLSQDNEPTNLVLDLCDYNEQVLRLVTLPNIFLTWYFATRGNTRKEQSDSYSQGPHVGELELSTELLSDFRTDLGARKINVTFYSGPWQGLADAGLWSSQDPSVLPHHDVILTSETIYSIDSLPVLVDTLQAAACMPLEDAMADAAIDKTERYSMPQSRPLTLVAAKVLYFGVGGGVLAFQEELARRRRRRAHADTVWSSARGVARVVLRVQWDE